MEKSTACSMICLNSCSRFLAVSFLLSVRPGSFAFGLRTTQAETTGPASGPLPASSMPAITKKPLFWRLFSIG